MVTETNKSRNESDEAAAGFGNPLPTDGRNRRADRKTDPKKGKKKMRTLEELAKKIDELMYGFDPYEYKDFYGEQGDGEPEILEMLILDPETVTNKLQEIAESDYEEIAEEAAKILDEMEEWSK